MFSKSNFLAKGTQSMTVLKKDLITYGFNGFLKTLENSHETTIPMRGGIFSQYRFELQTCNYISRNVLPQNFPENFPNFCQSSCSLQQTTLTRISSSQFSKNFSEQPFCMAILMWPFFINTTLKFSPTSIGKVTAMSIRGKPIIFKTLLLDEKLLQRKFHIFLSVLNVSKATYKLQSLLKAIIRSC